MGLCSGLEQGCMGMEALSSSKPVEVGDEELDVVVDSPAIRRLIEEIRTEETGVPRSYNRTFNRHNR